MPELKDLVPSPELCKRIPEGEFTNSALAWYRRIIFDDYVIYPRQLLNSHADAPAPTLAEIMAALSLYGEPADVTFWRTGQCSVLVQVDEHDREEVSESPENAALKLWLDLKGAEK